MFAKIRRDSIVNNLNVTRRNKIARYPNFPFTVNTPNIGNPGMEGDIFFNRELKTFFGHDGQRWIPLGGDGSAPIDATFVTLAADPFLSMERILTPGTGILITDGGAGGPVTVSTDGTVTCAPLDAEYVTLALDPQLLAERVLTAGSGLAIIDGGPNGPVTISATGLSLLTNLTLSNACVPGASLVVQGVGPTLQIRGLEAGTGITLTSDGSCVTISLPGTGVLNNEITLTDLCPGTGSLVAFSTGPNLQVKGLLAGTGIDLSTDSSCVTISIDSDALNTSVSLRNACPTGTSLVLDGSGPDLELRGLRSGTGLLLTDDATCVRLDIAASALNINVTLSNACPTGSLVSVGTGPNLQVKGLVAGTGIILSSDASCITISSTASGVTLANEYITVSNSPDLSSDLVLTAGTAISLTDGGALGPITVAVVPPLNPPGAQEAFIRGSAQSPISFSTAGILTPLTSPFEAVNTFTDGSMLIGSVFTFASNIDVLIEYYINLEIVSVQSPPPPGPPFPLPQGGTFFSYDVEGGIIINGGASLFTEGQSGLSSQLGQWTGTTSPATLTMRYCMYGTFIRIFSPGDTIQLGVRITSSTTTGTLPGPGPASIPFGANANYIVRRRP